MSNLMTGENIWNRICAIVLHRLKDNLNDIFSFKSFEENTLTLITDQKIDISMKEFIQHYWKYIIKIKNMCKY